MTPVNSQRQQVLSVITPNPGNSGNFFPPRENPFQSHPRLAPTPGGSWDNCDLLYSPTYQVRTNEFAIPEKQLVSTDISSLSKDSEDSGDSDNTEDLEVDNMTRAMARILFGLDKKQRLEGLYI